MIYVGSAESEEFDQVLDTIYVGPIPEGRHMFVFQVSIFARIFFFLSPVSQSENFTLMTQFPGNSRLLDSGFFYLEASPRFFSLF